MQNLHFERTSFGLQIRRKIILVVTTQGRKYAFCVFIEAIRTIDAGNKLPRSNKDENKTNSPNLARRVG